MLGIWGDPLAGILPVRSRLGILYDWTGSMSRSAYSLDMDGSGVFAGTVNGYNETGGNALGEITNATNVKTDNDTNNKFADTGDTLRNVNSSAKHLTETGVGDFQVIYGLELMSDLALGININKQGTALDDPNNWATKREDFTYTAANTTRKDYTVDAKQDAKTTIKNSQFLIMPGVRFKLTSGVEVGAAVMLNTVSNENKTDTSVTVTEDNAPTNAIANTFTATSTDASNIATTGLWANPYAAAQLDDDNDGTVNEDAVDGLDNDGDGLVDEDPVSPLTRKFSGTGIGVAPDARFKLSNNVALIARINLVSTPQTFEASNTNTYNSTRKMRV